MKFDFTSFTVQIAIKTDQKRAYEAWTKSEEMEKWFLEKCTYFNDQKKLADNDSVEEGGSYQFKWYAYDIIEDGKIFRANACDLFEFTFAGECLVSVSFTPVKDHIMVKLSQTNIPTDEKSLFNIRMGCLEGWTFYLANLKSYLEGGLDLRNKDEELRGLNN